MDFRQFTVEKRKSATTNSEDTTKPRGGYRYLPFTVAVYLVLAKYGIALQNCQTKVYRGFSASLRYIERKSAIEGTTKQRGGYRYTFYCHGIPLSGKNTMSLFILTWFLSTYVCSISDKKKRSNAYIHKVNPLLRVGLEAIFSQKYGRSIRLVCSNK